MLNIFKRLDIKSKEKIENIAIYLGVVVIGVVVMFFMFGGVR